MEAYLASLSTWACGDTQCYASSSLSGAFFITTRGCMSMMDRRLFKGTSQYVLHCCHFSPSRVFDQTVGACMAWHIKRSATDALSDRLKNIQHHSTSTRTCGQFSVLVGSAFSKLVPVTSSSQPRHLLISIEDAIIVLRRAHAR